MSFIPVKAQNFLDSLSLNNNGKTKKALEKHNAKRKKITINLILLHS